MFSLPKNSLSLRIKTLLLTEFKRIASPLKYHTRCLAGFPDKQGFFVKALCVKNIPDRSTPEQLKEIFSRRGEVTKIVLPPAKNGQGKRNFGFIHFGDRSSALKVVKETERYEINVLARVLV